MLIGIGLWLLDVPLAFALAVLVFMGSLAPTSAPSSPASSRCSSASRTRGWQLALAVLVLIIVVQFTEGTFLQPMIQSRRVELHPAVILLAVAAGGSLFGIAGAYLAVPVTAVVSAVYASLTTEEPVPWARGSGGLATRQRHGSRPSDARSDPTNKETR